MSDNTHLYGTIRNPRATREYKCCACGGAIPKRMRYRLDSGKWSDIGFRSFRMHEECWLAVSLLEEYSYGNDLFSEAFEYDWLWNYSPSRYKMKNERTSLARVYRMLRRVDPLNAKRIYLRGKSTRLNNRRWSHYGTNIQTPNTENRSLLE